MSPNITQISDFNTDKELNDFCWKLKVNPKNPDKKET